MDSGKIISRKLTREQIRDEAENFRKAYIFSEDLPVDIERIVEAILSISIIPEKSWISDPR
jgi:hypothetical protein